MKTRYLLLFACLSPIIFFFGCVGSSKPVNGDNNIIKKEIEIDIYDRIKISGSVDLFYSSKPDEAAFLRVEADENTIPLLDIKVKKKRLHIELKENVNPNRVAIYTNSPTLRHVESKGASKIQMTGTVVGDKLEIEKNGIGDFYAEDLIFDKAEFILKGSGDMRLGGKIRKGEIEIKGNGDVSAFDLQSDEMECEIKGNGDMEVYVNQKLSIEIKGNGDITYKGDPQIVKQKIKGSGSVKRK